jgi:hypothetical protein
VAHAYNLSYSRRSWFEASLASSLQDSISKNTSQKRAGGVAQSVGPEFKSQYCKKKREKIIPVQRNRKDLNADKSVKNCFEFISHFSLAYPIHVNNQNNTKLGISLKTSKIATLKISIFNIIKYIFVIFICIYSRSVIGFWKKTSNTYWQYVISLGKSIPFVGLVWTEQRVPHGR